jgi:aryl sulfotransferase
VGQLAWGGAEGSFDKMKSHTDQTAPFGGTLWDRGGQDFMLKGTNNRWAQMLSPQDIELYFLLALEKLGPECAHWLATRRSPDGLFERPIGVGNL